MASAVIQANPGILRQCREQIGLDIPAVEKKVKAIAAIENGKKSPTINQLDILSGLYNVPRWVFIARELPEKYRYDSVMPAFRAFAGGKEHLFDNHAIRTITARIERIRELILEFHEDMDTPLGPFSPPDLSGYATIEQSAAVVREWLEIPQGRFDFSQWKKKVESKGVFVFMTSRYTDWSHVDREMLRGMAIYHPVLPIIVINDSDYAKAQIFTLIHELGHLLKKETAINDWSSDAQQEKWCDQLAGNVLLPGEWFKSMATGIGNLDSIRKIADATNASVYACLVRSRQLGLVSQTVYASLERELLKYYEEIRKIQKKRMKDGGPARDRAHEILTQYGGICTRTFFQAYYNKEIGLHTLGRLFNLKKDSYVIEMEHQL